MRGLRLKRRSVLHISFFLILVPITQEPAILLLALCHSVYTDWFTLRYISSAFSSENETHAPALRTFEG